SQAIHEAGLAFHWVCEPCCVGAVRNAPCGENSSPATRRCCLLATLGTARLAAGSQASWPQSVIHPPLSGWRSAFFAALGPRFAFPSLPHGMWLLAPAARALVPSGSGSRFLLPLSFSVVEVDARSRTGRCGGNRGL